MIKAIKLKKIVFFVIIFCTIFGILYYKNFLFGNNINKNRMDKKIEKILNSINHYSAELEVEVNSNKTNNNYSLYQEVDGENSMQEVTSGEDIEGVKIELSEGNLKISNSRLKLEKIYENYQDLTNHHLFLNTFANDYQNEENQSSCQEENGEIILEVKLNSNQNTYVKYKKLYLNSNTLKPTKLEIKDNTKSETICIVYNNIELK